MKTKDGIEYQEGMTLYFCYHPEDETRWVLHEARDTQIRGGRVWFTSKSGRQVSLGAPSAYYGNRKNAIREIIAGLTAKRFFLDAEIDYWSQQL